MPKLPCLSGEQLVSALKRLGYEEDHRTGSHIILRHRDPPHRRLTIPDHKEIAKGTLRAILRQAGISVEELLRFWSSALRGVYEVPRPQNGKRRERVWVQAGKFFGGGSLSQAARDTLAMKSRS